MLVTGENTFDHLITIKHSTVSLVYCDVCIDSLSVSHKTETKTTQAKTAKEEKKAEGNYYLLLHVLHIFKIKPTVPSMGQV